MGITLPIGSRLDESQARRVTRQAEDYFSEAGRRAGDEFSRYVNQGLGRVDTTRSRTQAALLERAYDRAADAAGKLRTEEAKLNAVKASGTATDAQLIAHSERTERARRAEARAIRDATNALRDYHDAGRSSGGFMGGMSQSMDSLGTAARSFAMAGAPAAILAVGGAAITASGALAVLPGVLSGVAAGVGTLVLGMQGFGDALSDMGDAKKFAEDLQKLSPAAQQTALEFKKLVDGPLGELRKSTQESLFAGMAQEFHDVANVMLPSVKAATTGIADAFNGMAKGSLDQLMKPETATAFDATLRNITQGFTNLAPAAAPFTKAMTDIAQVGSSFLPGMATAITNAATAFSQFISHAAQTGQLAQWIREGGDMLKQIGTLAWEFGRAIAALMPTAKTVFGYVSGALHETADLLHEHPGLIWGVVGAFAAWKTIQGTAALITSLNTIKTALLALPATASTAAAGISAALSKIALPAWIAWMIGKEHDKAPEQAGANAAVRNNDINGFLANFQGGTGTFLPPGPGPDTRTPQQIQDQNRQRRMGLPGGAPLPPPVPGWDEFLPRTAGLEPWAPSAVPTVPADGGSGSKARQLPTVAAAGQDPMSLLQGFAPTASLYSAAGSVLDQQQKVAQATSDLNELMKSGTATQSEIIAKKNELARAEREQHEAELRLMEAKQQATNKSLKSMQSTHDAMSTLGAGLDKDLGISKGLPGLADNMVRFVGSLATAPLQAQLEAISKANPSQGGYGILGTLAAQGVFGPDHTGIAPIAGPSTYPTYPGMLGGYPGDAALLSMVPRGVGQYDNVTKDLSRGLVDCASGVEDLVNILDGKSTAGGSLWTGNAASVLPAMGFMPGMGGPGDFRIGYNSGHMQATLPGGTNVNFGSTSAIRAGGLDGGSGAYDPSFTSHYYRPVAAGPVATVGTPSYIPTPSTGGNILPPLTNPDTSGLSMPGGPPSGGAPMYPGMGQPNALPGVAPLGQVGPTQIGAAVGPPNGTGQGGINIDGSGLIAAGMAAGGMALNMMAPGVGQAAQTGFKLLDRGVKYLGQDAGILSQGLMETFLPTGGSQLAQNNWLTKIAGGLAGALPAIPNIAGKQAVPQPRGGQGGNTTNNTSTTNINVDATGRDDGQGIARDIAAHQAAAATTPVVGP
ncbi:hypothetical protein SBE55_10365 [Mycolicibacterium sp. 141076]|uniref:hypothetical protein n=1 Tax=Mycolicibacterium sp. 141076 TaxID=3090599 RepID=UPI00299F4496|nr:hypothetical protein [Mycolicibacterium sp. 141076]MDX1878221.1 hypothetical protein [Mycolicibacterium sp. 141076]